MIFKNLSKVWESNKFASSWIIGAKDEENSLIEVTKFASKILSNNHNLPVENNPDFRIIRREKNTQLEDVKFIVIDQIREMQNFLNKTTSLNSYKVVVIYQAHLMNLSASNCCLKVLEETPKNSFIFLITSSPYLLMPTIISRCAKVYINDSLDNKFANDAEYQEFLSYLKDKKLFLKKLSGNFNKTDFQRLSDSVMFYFKSFDKASFDQSIISKYDKILKIISKTKELDLDPKVSAIMILEELNNICQGSK